MNLSACFEKGNCPQGPLSRQRDTVACRLLGSSVCNSRKGHQPLACFESHSLLIETSTQTREDLLGAHLVSWRGKQARRRTKRKPELLSETICSPWHRSHTCKACSFQAGCSLPAWNGIARLRHKQPAFRGSAVACAKAPIEPLSQSPPQFYPKPHILTAQWEHLSLSILSLLQHQLSSANPCSEFSMEATHFNTSSRIR